MENTVTDTTPKFIRSLSVYHNAITISNVSVLIVALLRKRNKPIVTQQELLRC
jgi:hypothetical protein